MDKEKIIVHSDLVRKYHFLRISYLTAHPCTQSFTIELFTVTNSLFSSNST